MKMSIPTHDSESDKVLHEILEEEREQTHLLREIERELKPHHHFTLKGTQFMANPIPAGSTGQLGWTLLDNGVPVSPQPTLTLTYTSADPLVTFAAATTDASGGTIPLANQVVMTVGASDTQTSAIVNASAPAPDGSTAAGSLTVAVTPTPQKFTLVGTQLLP
jgi:hypothetical protein